MWKLTIYYGLKQVFLAVSHWCFDTFYGIFDHIEICQFVVKLRGPVPQDLSVFLSFTFFISPSQYFFTPKSAE